MQDPKGCVVLFRVKTEDYNLEWLAEEGIYSYSGSNFQSPLLMGGGTPTTDDDDVAACGVLRQSTDRTSTDSPKRHRKCPTGVNPSAAGLNAHDRGKLDSGI
ncbi:hypothetical protein MKZ38_000905 [Zalerion maritima]|uniref:Uncharacterized protein n=1 Tax=Zalerion maritima TaxID=339359 RepID=A0AAD5RZ16_9PEZI|nr:hypothetical protein MKZ38_000905 [Zalerion maritima]